MHRIEPQIALVFPGVGSQHTNMAKSFYDNSPIARETFEEASDRLNMNMAEICFREESADRLNEIDVSQLALVTASIAIYRVYLKEIGLKPSICLGHSLGEYSALCASGVIEFSDALQIVKQRGRIIKETIPSCDGTMIWVINIDNKAVEEACKAYSENGGELYVSAYDSPTQCSVSGKNDAIKNLTKLLENKGAIVYPLKMSGPFHSPLMLRARNEMKAVLQEYRYHPSKYEVLSNYSTLPYTGDQSVIDNLSNQLIYPVRWQESIAYLVNHNIKYVIEMGPKDVLKFLIRKNTKLLTPHSFNKFSQCDELKDMLFLKNDEYVKVIERCLKVATTTRNYNSNFEEYHIGAVRPYKEIEGIYDSILKENDTPSENQVIQAINMAISVMETKKIPRPLFEKRLNQITEGKLLQRYPLES
ncbi:ACP S-malonyltransferase [Paenibacillus amylolyticus]|uniref:ACP S-malonyltransferase n=1 Tax=Paenibacillus amylolyticus TaxID=1451 RepID=UPI003EBB7900